MSENESMTCVEFQSLLPAVLVSDELIDSHPHFKACLICRDLICNYEKMIDKVFPTHGDDWSESHVTGIQMQRPEAV